MNKKHELEKLVLSEKQKDDKLKLKQDHALERFIEANDEIYTTVSAIEVMIEAELKFLFELEIIEFALHEMQNEKILMEKIFEERSKFGFTFERLTKDLNEQVEDCEQILKEETKRVEKYRRLMLKKNKETKNER